MNIKLRKGKHRGGENKVRYFKNLNNGGTYYEISGKL